VGRDYSVGIATRYGLNGPGIELRWGQDFRHPYRRALGPTQPPLKRVPGLFPREKRPGRGVDHHPPSSAEVLLPFWAIVACSRVKFIYFLSSPFNDSTALCVPNLRRLLRVECSRPISILINFTMNIQPHENFWLQITRIT
jgi:hypothetical protein